MLFVTAAPFLIALFLSAFSIPIIIRVADAKHLMDEPDSDRKFHSTKTPTLGGVAIFIGTIFAFSATTDYLALNYEIKFMIPALLLLFFTGIKDDVIGISAFKKLLVQFFCAALLTVAGTMRITSLWGMLGITEISPIIGMAITFLVVVALINAFNLIDGINGLAGGLGFIASMFFGTWFAMTGASALSALSFSLAGALLGFLFFNFSSGKIFMGDTGSMIVGFIVSILAIKFIENNRMVGVETSQYYIKAAPGVAVAAVIIPLFDMSRVFFQRVLRKKHPFRADRLHIHYLLIDNGLSTKATTLVLYAITLLAIFISLALKELRSMEVVLILLAGFALLCMGLLLAKRSVAGKQSK